MQERRARAVAMQAKARDFHYAIVSTGVMTALIAAATYLGSLVR
ncbi:hypothetical protein [Afifella sp. IM 167]|nr:hypothetical protein [Afifella sp. IM 167]